jgi:hypothetical protein
MLDCWCNNLRWKIRENYFLIAYSSVKRNRFAFKFTESNIYLCAAQIPCENLEFKCLFGNELRLFFKIFLKSVHQTIQNIKKLTFSKKIFF